MQMPGRHGFAAESGDWHGSYAFAIPPHLIINQRGGNIPGEYVASQVVELSDGFSTGSGADNYVAYIADSASMAALDSAYQLVNGNYPYGLNGQLHDYDYGQDMYTALYWEYDSRTGRRWNVDPVINPSESPYAAFNNNPLTIIDPNGSTPLPHKVKKGETLTKIAKKYGTTVGLLAKINDIKDPDKIKAGQQLIVGTQMNADDAQMMYGNPEQDFTSNTLTKYNNNTNSKFSYNLNASVGQLAMEFASDDAKIFPESQNTVILGGPLLREIKRMPSVKNLINQGLAALNSDNKLTPGEYYKSSYSIGSLTGSNGRRIIGESIKDLFSRKRLSDNKFFSAENWLGSYGFSMRVTGTGQVAIAIYDSKTIESATDRRRSLQKLVPELTTTYQRYMWLINVDNIQSQNSVYEK